jgi:hypothetical protein
MYFCSTCENELLQSTKQIEIQNKQTNKKSFMIFQASKIYMCFQAITY